MPPSVENEIRAVVKLCKPGAHENIVAVLGHGLLRNSMFYFFDMELCDYNLDSYIQRSPRDSGQDWHDMSVSNWNKKMSSICGIMNQISNGLVYIHSCGEIHRD